MKKFKSNYFFRLLLLLLTLIPAISLAQTRLVTGTIFDTEEMPIPGATIMVQGTNRGTQTDFDGKFSIEVNSGEVLVISFVGMDTQEIPVTDDTNDITIHLEENSTQLEEVVVVGYGQTKRSDVTGSIVSVGEKELKSRPVNNAVEAIQGKAAGVDITSSQRPGTLGNITIRGVRSLTASNTPLYVVDGIPLISGGIENLNPNDIETIDILKDASATAIYGSRGANGVVIVTTKKGKTGRFSISLNYATTVETLVNRTEMMNASDYITFRRWAKYYSDPNTFPRGDMPTEANDFEIFVGSSDPSAWANISQGWESGTWDGSRVTSTDWTDFVTQTGVTNQYTINVSGGSEKMKAFGSFGYLDNKGTIVGQRYKRYTGKVSVDITPKDWFSFGGTLNSSYGVIDYGQSGSGRNGLVNTSGLYDSAQAIFAYAVPYDDQGNRIEFPGGDVAVKTVIDEVKYSTDERINFRTFGSFYSQIDFGEIFPTLKGLKYRMNFGPDLSVNRNGLFLDENSVVRTGSNYASLYKDQIFSYTLDNLIFYNKQFDKHALDLTLLQSQTEYRFESSSMAADNIPYSDQLWNALTNSNVTLSSWGSDLIERSLLSYMGRVNYTYDDKYILTVSGRYDGATQLAEGNRWAFFPSMAASWILTKENFLKNEEWLNQLKLRFGVGTTGNSAINPYSTKGALTPLFYPNGGTLVPGTTTNTNLANQDLTWEKTTQYNIGIDYSLFNYRITGGLDFYTSRTKDLLLLKSIPTVTGYTDTYANVGETKSSGIDLTLNTTNIQTENFGWETTLSASYQTNEIIELSNGAENDINNNWFIGQQLGVIYGFENDGLWQAEDAAEMALYNANGHTFSPGLTKPVDQNGDNKIDATNDRVIIGSTLPKYIVGVTNNFSYKNFDLSIFIYGRLDYTYDTGGEAQTGRFNQRQIDYYTENNTNAEYQKPIYTAGTGDPYAVALGYRDGSFLKIRNISLGYNFSKSFTNNLNIDGLKLYVQVLNPGMIYSNIDWLDLDVDSPTFNRGFTAGLNMDF
ncbi:SusC/RagA family TonB-linked outer membrane protein [Neptunitalea lumnitzerae]|uniref:SusC/RagA family TonB-linked outer membrane protein n=1 Tax=Neptunitalea lumnitzerae TaxID=2965509 RepID=A0ABQ5MIV9_9FLAO|nr:TonB-dependent receptor [Neptunitalea sp. Y10]GLB49343.1 SusC/RagA family TonB-linked outer membrane protein [Neptunitalea sp. Y10]